MKIKHGFLTETSIRVKVVAAVTISSCIILFANLVMYGKINSTINQIDSVYATNVSLNDFSETLDNIQNSVFSYLNTKNSSSLEDYYRYDAEYRDMIEQLNQLTVNSNVKLMEKTIYNLSEDYLDIVSETIQAKRGRNITKYSTMYEEATKVYNYLNAYIVSLNQEQFTNNSRNYEKLLNSLQSFEISSVVIMLIISVVNITSLTVVIRNLLQPLHELVKSANEVAGGNLDIELVEPKTKDEVGVVTTAFNSMVVSIQDYIVKFKEKIKHENELKQKEILMESHLKDAQLKYLQAQINPHFLFNTLNAGAQLAMMEDAEKTCLYIENMADLFRYNVQKLEKDATLQEELDVVDNYMHIMNVRFSNDIQYQKQIHGVDLEKIKIPSMVIQPIIENSVNYGISDIDWEGKISIEVTEQENHYILMISDNGKGMDPDQIKKILNGTYENHRNSKSTGIGLINVISRLSLFYGEENILSIESKGKNQGTCVCIKIPKNHVHSIDKYGDIQNTEEIEQTEQVV